MKENYMTALVSAFVRCYHEQNSNLKIYDDKYAKYILTKEEYESILDNMTKGIKYFNPNFIGTKEEAIKWIVNNQLGPSVLGRSAFNKRSLDVAIKLGCKQYVVYASGYSTSTLDQKIKCYEIDKEEVIEDKLKRLKSAHIKSSDTEYIKADFTSANWLKNLNNSSYDKNQKSFNSLLGLSYYLSKNNFRSLIKTIASNITEGSSVLFDYQTTDYSKEAKINEELAASANENMLAKYNYQEIESILASNNLYIYEYLNHEAMTKEYFYDYNTINPDSKIIAPKSVAYILAVKK